jgi:hypothetical protein
MGILFFLERIMDKKEFAEKITIGLDKRQEAMIAIEYIIANGYHGMDEEKKGLAEYMVTRLDDARELGSKYLSTEEEKIEKMESDLESCHDPIIIEGLERGIKDGRDELEKRKKEVSQKIITTARVIRTELQERIRYAKIILDKASDDDYKAIANLLQDPNLTPSKGKSSKWVDPKEGQLVAEWVEMMDYEKTVKDAKKRGWGTVTDKKGNKVFTKKA